MLGDERHTRSGGACGKNWPSGAKPILHHNAADYSPGINTAAKFVYKRLRYWRHRQRRQLPSTSHWLVAMDNTSKA